MTQQEHETSSLTRPQLIDAIFALLDVKKEQVLHSTELQDYAMFTGLFSIPPLFFSSVLACIGILWY